MMENWADRIQYIRRSRGGYLKVTIFYTLWLNVTFQIVIFPKFLYNRLSISCHQHVSKRFKNTRTAFTPVLKPKPGVSGYSYRRIVHYEDKYTIKPLNVTNLAGRDPFTGRVVAKGIGGGIKHKYHWIYWFRYGPKNDPPTEEKVIQVFKDGCRTCFVALVCHGDEMRYYLATENMKAGDIIKTSSYIPRIPVRANEGDSYPLGALPNGTQVNCVEKYPGCGGSLIHSAGTFATILRRQNNRVIIQLPSKIELSLHETCQATVGRLSNIEHGKTPIGSAQRNRELGNRPRSGLWKRKDGRHGRKIKKLPPVREVNEPEAPPPEPIRLTLNGMPIIPHNPRVPHWKPHTGDYIF